MAAASKRPSTSVASGSTPKRSRKTLTLEQKLEVLEKIDKGQKTSVIVKALNLNESTIRTIRRNADKIRASAKAGAPMNGCKSTYARPLEMQCMEKMLATWIDHQNKTHVPVSFNLIQAKAISIYDNLEAEDKKPFSASSGWFANFRKRFGFHNLKMVGEAASADSRAAEEDPAVLNKIIEEGEYFPKQVSNVDETDLYWKKLANRTYISMEETTSTAPGFKVSEDQLTLQLGANAKGDCKLKPALIYHSENPRALKGYDKERSNEDLLEMERERVQLMEEPAAASEQQPRRTLTATNLSHCMDLLRQAMKIIEENDPNVERSTAVARGVMNKMACYEVLLKEKQQEKKQQPITEFFQAYKPNPVMESDTDPDAPNTPDMEAESDTEQSSERETEVESEAGRSSEHEAEAESEAELPSDLDNHNTKLCNGTA